MRVCVFYHKHRCLCCKGQGKKQSVDSELSCGRGSKFSTQGSNRMLVV